MGFVYAWICIGLATWVWFRVQSLGHPRCVQPGILNLVFCLFFSPFLWLLFLFDKIDQYMED